jgi:hydroxyacylglutathione hydrolase
MLIDAGERPGIIVNTLEDKDLELVYLVNTHGHGDHIAGNEFILQKTGAKLCIHPDELPLLKDPNLNLSSFFGVQLRSPDPHKLVNDKDTLEVGQIRLQIYHTPGHSPGHICLIGDGHAFVGDLLFKGSIGRTDFPYGSQQLLIESILKKIYLLPDKTILYPGHGPDSTVEEEKNNNPYVSV